MKVRKFEGEYWIKVTDVNEYFDKLYTNIRKQFSITALKMALDKVRQM